MTDETEGTSGTTEVGGKPTNTTPTAKNAAQSVVTVDDETDVPVNIGETIGDTQDQGNISRNYIIVPKLNIVINR